MSLWLIIMLSGNYKWVRWISHVDKYKIQIKSQSFIYMIDFKVSKGFDLLKAEEEMMTGY